MQKVKTVKEPTKIRPVGKSEWKCKLYLTENLDGANAYMLIDCPFCHNRNSTNHILWKDKNKPADTTLPVCCGVCGNFFDVKNGKYLGPNFAYAESRLKKGDW